MLNEGQNKLYKLLKDYVPSGVYKRKNNSKTWLYGYNEKYDIIIISKSGQIGDIITINGLAIALPPSSKNIYKRDSEKKNNFGREKNYLEIYRG